MVRYYVHYRLLQLGAVCETAEDAEYILNALHRTYGGRPGYVETKETPDVVRQVEAKIDQATPQIRL